MAYRKIRGKWLQFDDTSVTLIDTLPPMRISLMFYRNTNFGEFSSINIEPELFRKHPKNTRSQKPKQKIPIPSKKEESIPDTSVQPSSSGKIIGTVTLANEDECGSKKKIGSKRPRKTPGLVVKMFGN